MKSSNELFQLIKSLNQGEKWGFKIYSQRHFNSPGNNYVKLFDAIDLQDEYDEAALKKKFAKEQFVKQFSVTKTNLYASILDSLEAYRSNESPTYQIRAILNRVEILHEKSLLKQCRKLIKKARKIAQDNELLLLEQELIQWERRVMAMSTPIKKLEKVMGAMEKEQDLLADRYKASRAYADLARQVHIAFHKHGPPRNDREMERYLPYFQHPLMRNESLAKTAEARFFFYTIIHRYHYYSGKDKAAHDDFRKVIDLMEEHPDKIAENKTAFLVRYVTMAYNFLYYSVQLRYLGPEFDRRLQGMLDYPRQVMAPKKVPPDVLAKINLNQRCAQLRKYAANGDFITGTEIAQRTEKEFATAKSLPNTTITDEPYRSLGLFYFAAGQYENAIETFNRLLSNPKAPAFADLYGELKIIQLIIHYQLGNHLLLENSISNTYRYLNKNTRLYQWEKIMLQFFRKKISLLMTDKQKKQAFIQLNQHLQPYLHDQYEKLNQQNFDLMAWIQSKLEERPMPEVIREKAARLFLKQ